MPTFKEQGQVQEACANPYSPENDKVDQLTLGRERKVSFAELYSVEGSRGI
jgi:hypothetical protein